VAHLESQDFSAGLKFQDGPSVAEKPVNFKGQTSLAIKI
jgi:hypothetical protein